MNKHVIRYASVVGKACAVIAGGAAYMEFLPPKYAVLAGLAFGIISIIKDAAISAGDLADDGIRNNSFKP